MSTFQLMTIGQTNPGHAEFPPDLLIDLRIADGRSLRVRLEHTLRAAIQARRLPGGTPLPPSRTLATELGVSRSVVVEAYRNLGEDGYLEARQGSGTRVRHDATAGLPAAEEYDPATISPALQRSRGQFTIRLVGGLPSPTLFPRTQWLRHYRAAITEIPDRHLTYPDPRGAAALRTALAAYLGRVRGLSTARDRIVVTGGVTQAITLVCRALHRGGARRVAVEDPCFGPHRTAIAMTGLETLPVPVDSSGLDPADLDGLEVDAVLVAPAHSYPAGIVMDARRRRALAAWATRRDVLVLEDDYDAEFRYDRVPVGALQGLAPDNVVYLGSASKTVSPALRLGWLAAPAALIASIVQEKYHDDMGSALLEQLAFARFVERGDFTRYLRRVRPVYRARRAATIDALTREIPQARWQGADAGLHIHVRLPSDVDEQSLVVRVGDRGVYLEEARWNWADPRSAPPSLIIGYGAPTESMVRRGIAVIAEELGGADGSRDGV